MDDRGANLAELTEREVEILEHLASGLSDQEIANKLFLSLNTIKWYNRKIYGKLGVSSRTQAVARSREILQVGQPAIPKSRALLSRPRLPAEITRFIGRDRECREIGSLLQQNRLVTLVGPPGTGKTRLALHLARSLEDQFRDGADFIPFESVPSPDQILWAIAEHLDLHLHSSGDSLKQLLQYLSDKNQLLVLDNFDHLVSGGWILAEILKGTPEVKILVTSRERLTLYGEASYPLGGLTLPDQSQGKEISRSEAAELFIERAKSVRPNIDFTPDSLPAIARICRLVEGMPLGIELAATWIDTLLLPEIAREIEHNLDILEAEFYDLPHNQRSIRAAFDRSWNLLGEAQRTAFRRLAVFRGGFTRQAGEAVAGVSLRDLQALVNKSLLTRNPQTGRYHIHELLRYYAAEKLEHSGEAKAISATHAAYFADFMAARWLWMKDHRQKNALAEIEADIDNARAAWHYWITAGEVNQIRKFLHGFWSIYDVRGWYPAGIDLFEGAVEVMRSCGAPEAEACLGWLLAAQGLFSLPVADYDKSKSLGPNPLFIAHGIYSEGEEGPHRGLSLAQKGIQILKGLENFDEMRIVPLISIFITASRIVGMEDVAVKAAEECLEVARRIDDQWAIAKAKQFLAVRAIEEGNYPVAETLAYEAYHAFEASGNHWSSSLVCIEVLGLLGIVQQQLNTAREWIERGLKEAEEIDFKYSIQTAYWQLGYLAALEEDYAEAGKFWHKAMRVSDHMLGGRSFIGLGSTARARKP